MKEEIFKGLAEAVIAGDTEKAEIFAKKTIDEGIDAYEAIMEGCAKGMSSVSEKYECGDMFVPDILCSAEAMNVAMDILKPYLKAEAVGSKKKIVLGVCQGDIHDIGKNLVKLMLETGGYQVIDVGRDVPKEAFVEAVKRENADVCAMSSLMTTSMIFMPEIIQEVKKINPRIITIVGGGPLSPDTAEVYGADGYAKDASMAVKVTKALLSGGS